MIVPIEILAWPTVVVPDLEVAAVLHGLGFADMDGDRIAHSKRCSDSEKSGPDV